MTTEKVKTCPFCNYDEGWVQDIQGEFFVECNVCKSRGPIGKDHEMARNLWNGELSNIDEGIDSYLQEDAMGGVSAPMATLNNTPGIGNAVPATQGATTGAQFTSNAVKGSGDRWDNQTSKTKKKKTKNSKKSKKNDVFTINTLDDYMKTTK